MRQAPINFPFKFVFNRDLVSHAIYITDLNRTTTRSVYDDALAWFVQVLVYESAIVDLLLSIPVDAVACWPSWALKGAS